MRELIAVVMLLMCVSAHSSPCVSLYKKLFSVQEELPSNLKSLDDFVLQNVDKLKKYNPDVVRKQHQMLNKYYKEEFRYKRNGPRKKLPKVVMPLYNLLYDLHILSHSGKLMLSRKADRFMAHGTVAGIGITGLGSMLYLLADMNWPRLSILSDGLSNGLLSVYFLGDYDQFHNFLKGRPVYINGESYQMNFSAESTMQQHYESLGYDREEAERLMHREGFMYGASRLKE